MAAFLVFVVLGVALFVVHTRLTKIERTMAQVIDEVQRQRDILAGKPVAAPMPEPVTEAAPPAAPESAKPELAKPELAKPELAKPELVEPEAIPAMASIALPAPVATAATPEPEPAPRRAIPARIGFEELFGSKLPIWAGGVTLAVAGLFIVKYAIDTGLITPLVRVILAYLFSALLVAGAEVARRWSATAIDPRVAQALAGAGVASAYGATLIAANLYHLIDPATAFVALAAITAGALGLALRFGPPSAVLGLVGGLAAPALVGGNGSIGTLAVYLSLTILGLAGVARHRKWRWLAMLALAGGFGWGSVMLVMQAMQGTASLAIGSYLLLLAFAVPFVAGRDARGLIRLIPPAVAAVQLAILIVQGGYAPLTWGLYGLLSIAVIVLARIDAAQRLLPGLAMIVGVLVITLWPHPAFALLAPILIAGGLLFAGDAALRLRGGDIQDSGQFAATLLFGYVVGFARLPGMTTHGWVAIAVALAAVALALGVSLWRDARRDDGRFAGVVATGLVLIDVALVLGLQRVWLAPAMVALAAAGAVLVHIARDAKLAATTRFALGIGVCALFAGPDIGAELVRFTTIGEAGPSALSGLRIALTALGIAVCVWREIDATVARLVQVVAALVASFAIAQVVPGPWLAVANFAAAVALIEGARAAHHNVERIDLRPAIGSFVVIGALWTLVPLGRVLTGAITASAGVPLLVTDLPVPDYALLRLILPALIIGVAALRLRDVAPIARRLVAGAAWVLGIAGAFVLWKQVFHLENMAAFAARGMAERVVLTSAFFAGGWAAWRWSDRFAFPRSLALTLSAIALARTIGFDMALYNPLWRAQDVGALPIANLLAPAFLLPLVWIDRAARREPEWAARLTRPITGLQVALVLMFTATSVRQIFHGGILSFGDVAKPENVAFTLAAIALAIGFLIWGIRVRVRMWRIASLVLMLGAVGKVFLFDAAGLDGLLRIASFVALGFSLIGIGWLYSRYLKADPDVALTEH